MLISLLLLVLLYFIILYCGARCAELYTIIANAIPINEWENYINPLGIDPWFSNDLLRSIMEFLLFLFIALAVIVLVFRINLFELRPRLSKQERDNYTNWQGHFERKRGLYRVMYNDKGDVEMGVIEAWYDRFFDELIALQNKIVAEYNRPIYEYWNRQVDHTIPITGKSESLDVTSKEGGK